MHLYGLVILEFIFYFFPNFQVDDNGVAELKQGGAIYLIGVVFFKLDGRLPLAHAIWHLHVVIASMIHYSAVAHYLIGPHLASSEDEVASVLHSNHEEL